MIADIGIKHILNQSFRSIKHKRILTGIKYVDFLIDASNVTIQNGQTVSQHCPGHLKNGKKFRRIFSV